MSDDFSNGPILGAAWLEFEKQMLLPHGFPQTIRDMFRDTFYSGFGCAASCWLTWVEEDGTLNQQIATIGLKAIQKEFNTYRKEREASERQETQH